MDSGLRRLLQQLKARRAYKEETITLNMCSVFLIDIALIFIGVAGLFMDRKKVNLLGRGKEEIELAQLPNDSADVSRQEVTKLEQSSEAGTQRTFDPAEALPTKQITFMQVLKRYNRVVTLFYGEALPRPLKALRLDMEIFLLFAFAAISIVAQIHFSLTVSVVSTFLFMRCLGLMPLLLHPRTGGCCDKVKNVVAFILYLAVAVIAHMLMFGFVLRSSQKQFREWAEIVAVAILCEFVLWDLVLKPLGIFLMARKSLRLQTLLMG